ncbi:hypothetical protein KXD93_26410 [Mucilaginibacter sp. BJC16-A38]|uniref:hypothetical protein n=1 Tax=Mucilaginibacter phenanthrenivorans TaxID=1234842 RepID=UPI0021574780|nr:hypothetical protein [Mucilaginibacter phenanthrenivorans]MCR8561214.1 hypothetical protein [Mucilaginibacter phenanthrenivorans]
MSGIFKSENIDKDFTKFQAKLAESGKLLHLIDVKNKPFLKKYHRLTYLIALFEGKLEENFKEDNKFLFLNELLSDLLSNCSLIFIGFYHPSLIITRRLIENFYNHIYYFDHPVEFELLNLGRNDYTPMHELKLYFDSHPLIKAIEDKNTKIFNDQLFHHYQELCRTVHTKGEIFMGLAKNLEEVKSQFDVSRHINTINISILSIVYLLYKFHRSLSFTNVEKNLISNTFTKTLRSPLLS